MKKDGGIVNMQGKVLSVLSCVLLCAAVFLCGREVKTFDLDDGGTIQDSTDMNDSPTIKAGNIVIIAMRDQIYFICPPCVKDERYDTALAKWKEMKYGEAYRIFMEIREERKNEYTEDDYETAVVNNVLGCLCLDMGKHEEGYEYLNSAYVAMKKLYGESGVPVLAVLSDITYYDYVTGRLEQCLEDAHTVVSAEPPLCIWIVTNRVQMLVSYELGEYTYAIRGAYMLIDSFMKEQDESFTWDDMLSLQDYLAHQGKDKYEVFVYRCLAMLSSDIANSFAAIASDEEGRESAKKWYEASLFICGNRIGEDSKGMLTRVNIEYAYFLGSCGETEKSFPLLEENMIIQESFGDTEFPCTDLVETYGYYGDMLTFLQNDQKGGLAYYEKARDLSEYIYGVNHRKTARTYFNLGKFYAITDRDEEALENLKKSEEIRENILLLKDKDTVDLYLYMAAIYQKQGKYDLANKYLDRRMTIEIYLSPQNMVTSETLFSQTVSGEDESTVVDLSLFDAGEAWQIRIDDYINALQKCDASALMDVLQLEFVELIPVIAGKELGVEVDKEEHISLYHEFYQEELLSLDSYLAQQYGDGYNIRFEPYEINFFSNYEINVANDYLFARYDSEIVVEDMVNIKGKFQVIGETGAILGEENDGFLCGELVMIEANGEWKLGVSDGFPKMPQDRLKDALGVE